MAGILKNQLVKRLASFTKGLSVDKIDLDILSGSGYLDNLELDEQFMSSVLELPEWMCFTKILCSKIKLKVSFTKLKSEPIRVFIDTVYVEADISKHCNRTDINVQQKLLEAGLAGSGTTSYGYMEQVIDGMHITVNTITLTLSLAHQYLTTELAGVELVSTNRKWKQDDLRKTRVFVSKDEVLVYKMLTVHHAKFEIYERGAAAQGAAPVPLKFNFNMIQLLITMKKLVATNEVISACLKVILDDILLVFTPSQLQILLAFTKELSEVIELAAPQKPPTKVPVPTKTAPRGQTPKSFLQRFSRQQEESSDEEVEVEVVSDNVLETSYHLKTGTITVLLCDDEAANSAGSLQLSIEVVQIDLFPHRTCNASRRHWLLPAQYVKDAQQWSTEMLGDFCETFNGPGNPLHNIYEMIVVLRCEHFQILPVMGTKSRHILGPLLVSDKTKFGLKESEPAAVATISTYYTDREDIQLPAQNIYTHLNPTEVNFDTTTMWWLREFTSSTITEDFKLMLFELSKEERNLECKLKMNLVLPHITVPLTVSERLEPGSIKGLQIWFSKIIISNLNNSTYLPLLSLLWECLETPLMSHADQEKSEFPNAEMDEACLPKLKNKDMLPGIIEELAHRNKLRQELLDDKIRQRRATHSNLTSPGSNVTSSSPRVTSPHVTSPSPSVTSPSPSVTSSTGGTTDSPPSCPGTPVSRRSSVSSVLIPEIPYNAACLQNIPLLFPLLKNMVLGISFENFSADFLYETEHLSAETHRSRRFISDIPIEMWVIEDPVSPPDSDTIKKSNVTKSSDATVNGHTKLRRNLLRKQETLTPPITDYLILAKPLKSVHCMVDRDQYLFLLQLQGEMQSFLEKIVLSVTQIFTSTVQESTNLKLVALLEHVMLDVTLPGRAPLPGLGPLLASPPGTASTSLSRLSTSSLGSRFSAEEVPRDILLLESRKASTEEEGQKGGVLNWVALSRSDSNLTSLSERLTINSDEDALAPPLHLYTPLGTHLSSLGISSIANDLSPLAKGDSKETLLKYIMRVNKKRETVCVGTQTATDKDLVARNYQQLHSVTESRDNALYATANGQLSHEQLQVHCGGVAVTLHSSRDVITKLTCSRVLLLDSDLETKARGHFPDHKWRTNSLTYEPQLRARIQIKELSCLGGSSCTLYGPTTPSRTKHESAGEFPVPETTYQVHCDLEVSDVTASLRDVTLEGLTAFMQPHPTLQASPVSLTCLARNCDILLEIAGTSQAVHLSRVRVKLKEDESVEVGEVCCCGDSVCTRDTSPVQEQLDILKTENIKLREQLNELLRK